MLRGSKGVSSDATAMATQSENFGLPRHSMLEPHRLQNFLTMLPDEL